MKQIKATISDYWELTKPGVTFMVLVSTFGGFYLGTVGSLNIWLLCNTLIGSWLVAAGTNALNQLVERDLDAKMKRTIKRPLPAGRLSPTHVRNFSVLISLAGIVQLWLVVNWGTAILAALTLLSYILIYTPLKRKHPVSTVVGAVPGALPALGGWVAVRGNASAEGWILFAILFFWQIPHFLAIAWLYREDYARGGFPVLPVVDADGIRTSFHIVTNCLALLSVSLLPTLAGLTGTIYFAGAFFLGVGFLIAGIHLAKKKTLPVARRLLHVSIIYLPALMILLFFDKTGM